MKKIIPLLLFAFMIFQVKAGQTLQKPDALPENNFSFFFEKAYQQHPSIPKGILEAVAYTNSRFHHIIHEAGEEGNCMGLPKYYGVMGLVADGKNYFQNNLTVVSNFSHYSPDELISSPEKNILAYADAYEYAQKYLLIDSKIENQVPVLVFLSELPNNTSLQNNFAMNTHLYSVLNFLNDPNCSVKYGFPNYAIDLAKIFGEENLKVLSSSFITVSSQKIYDKNGNVFKGTTLPAVMSADYPSAAWLASPNYNSRSLSISAVVIHDTEGSYAGTLSWFQNTSSQVSAHYVVRSSDGQITQMVLESNRAWHVGSENDYTIGIEHEGYAAQTGWYTTAMYTESAKLVCDICNSGYGILPTTCYNGPSCSGTCVLSAAIKIKGHQHYPNQTHTDPGPNWNWYTYYSLVNNCGAASQPPTALAVQQNNCPQIGVTLNWQNSGSGWFVDITDDATFTNYWNKAVPSLTTIGCPGGFANNSNPSNYLGFLPNTTYYWRVWDGNVETYGSSFTTPSCAYTESTCSGTLDDSGGSSAPYTGNEDWTDVIQPASASSVTINFTSFDLELNSDSLYIYDGATTASALIGGYTGTTSPGTVSSTGGAMTLHFISDPFVNNAGFTSTWTCTSTTGINEQSNSAVVNIYPNPFSETATMQIANGQIANCNFILYNVFGEEVKNEIIRNASQFVIHRNGLPSGMYFYKLKNENGIIAKGKIIAE